MTEGEGVSLEGEGVSSEYDRGHVSYPTRGVYQQ